VAEGEAVAIFATSNGTYAPDGDIRPEREWQIPAAFLGVVRGGRIARWESYSDASIVYDLMRGDDGAAQVPER